MQTPEAPPVNPLPPVVVVLFLAIIGIELTFMLAANGMIGGPAGIGWRLNAIQTYGFSGRIYDWMIANGFYPREHVMRFVTYPFIHVNFTQALFAGVILLAMGKMVGEVMGGWAVAVLFFACSIGGALAYAIVLNDPVPLVGSFPAVYGLIGGFTWLLWRNLSLRGEKQARAFSLIGFLMGIQLVFGLLFGSDGTWVAEIAGFVIGFALSFVLSPGGFDRVLKATRRD
jgi:membrane associated rhomboid family serine protease